MRSESNSSGLGKKVSRTIEHGEEGRAWLPGALRPTWLVLPALALTCSIALLALVPRVALAAGETTASASPIYVLSIWTDDADDQADALTQSLRSQLKAAPGWSLAIASQSFETLAIALRCPPKPDAACLQRIADQLRVDHYVWGTMSKKGGQVNADVHLWSRGKPQVDASAAYADSLTDPTQPALHAIAASLLSKLTGSATATTGTLLVRAGDGGGFVLVDGQERAPLRGGLARFPVDAGAHTVTVQIPGFNTSPQTVTTAANAEQEVNFTLSGAEVVAAPPGVAPTPNDSGTGGVRARGILGYSAIVVGAGLLVVSGIEAANWFSDKSAGESDRQNVPRTVTDVCADPGNASAVDACNKSKNAKTVSTLGWIFAAVGAVAAGTGIWLVVTDTPESGPRSGESSNKRPRTTAGPRVEVLPVLGAHERALDLRVSF